MKIHVAGPNTFTIEIHFDGDLPLTSAERLAARVEHLLRKSDVFDGLPMSHLTMTGSVACRGPGRAKSRRSKMFVNDSCPCEACAPKYSGKKEGGKP